MKAFSDLEQSKKLAEILPIESADMRYHTISHYNPYPCDELVYTVEFDKASGIDIPCWSLAALLSVLDFPSLTQSKEDEWEMCVLNHQSDEYIEVSASNPTDACYEMILKLKEQNLL